MPPPLDIDRDEVRILALQHGAREAARMCGLNENTVIQWASRFNWFAPCRPTPATIPLPPTLKPINPIDNKGAISVIKPVDAVINSIAEDEKRTKTALARAIRVGAEHASNMDGEKVMDKSRQIKDLAGAGALIHGWGDKASDGMQINLLCQNVENLHIRPD